MVNSLCIGEDTDWSTSFELALQNINSPYILIGMEDYLLTGKVDNTIINNLLKYQQENKVGYFRLYPCPGPTRIIGETAGLEIGEIAPDDPYRVSLQAAIWDKQVVLSLLKKGESAWDFETSGTKRSKELPTPFLSVSRAEMNNLPFPYFCTGVVKGYWLQEAIELCRQHGVEVDTKTRAVEPWLVRLKRTSAIWGSAVGIAARAKNLVVKNP